MLAAPPRARCVAKGFFPRAPPVLWLVCFMAREWREWRAREATESPIFCTPKTVSPPPTAVEASKSFDGTHLTLLRAEVPPATERAEKWAWTAGGCARSLVSAGEPHARASGQGEKPPLEARLADESARERRAKRERERETRTHWITERERRKGRGRTDG